MKLIDADELKKNRRLYYPNRTTTSPTFYFITEKDIDEAPTVFEISDNPKNGKEVLIKYCLEHSGEEIYNLLKQLFHVSMNWTDSSGFIIEWLENGGTT